MTGSQKLGHLKEVSGPALSSKEPNEKHAQCCQVNRPASLGETLTLNPEGPKGLPGASRKPTSVFL